MKEQLKIAYEELRRLKVAPPSWETYAKIADLTAVIKYYEGNTDVRFSGEIGGILGDIRDSFGAERGYDILASVISDFSRDIETVSPHLNVCLINKIKERLKD